VREQSIILWFGAVMATLPGCAAGESRQPLRLLPGGRTTEVVIAVPPPIGDMRLWIPEAIMSNTGGCAVYPVGSEWTRDGNKLIQHVGRAGNFSGGNLHQIDNKTLECAGVRFPKDNPVAWRTTLVAGGDSVEFAIRLTNLGSRTLEKAGAAVCLKFFNAPWWSDEHTFVRSAGELRSLAQLGREAGPPNGFEAYLLDGRTFDNVFYRDFWGFNRNRLDVPIMVSECSRAGQTVVIRSDRAYFLHSNAGNPCTDIMLAFGDVAPGMTADAAGRVEITTRSASDILAGP